MQHQSEFEEIANLIRRVKAQAVQAVNRQLVDLYWQLGEYISHRVAEQQWGKAVVVQLATFLAGRIPNAGGFSDKNLWRMKQFYETYCDQPDLRTLLNQVSWSNQLILLSGTKSLAEKEFYLRL